jgi:hypothetical protein
LWTIPVPECETDGAGHLDCTGTRLRYDNARGSVLERDLRQPGRPDRAVSPQEVLALGERFVFLKPNDAPVPGLALAVPGAAAPFLRLSPDEPIPGINNQFTPDGRYLVWGGKDGTVHVADMDRVRESLGSVGLGW